MTPLQIFNTVVEMMEKKPLFFYPIKEQQELCKNTIISIFKLKNNLESQKLQDTNAYKIVMALEKDVINNTIEEVHFLQHLGNLMEVYRVGRQTNSAMKILNELEKNLAGAKKSVLEYYTSLEVLQKRGTKMNEEEKVKSDLDTLQKVGIFYVLEYTLQVLYEFNHISDADKKNLLEHGLVTKAGSLPAYLPLENTFRKELCYRIHDIGLRNDLLATFYNWEEVLYNKKVDFKAIFEALRRFNVDILSAFDKKGLKIFKAAIYAPFGNDIPIAELISKI